MRLPQSKGTPFSIPVFSLCVVLVLAASMPMSAASTPQRSKQLTSSATNLKFGSVVVSQSATQSVTLTNTGQGSVTITSVNVSGSGFSDSGLSLPTTVAAGKSVNLSVTFAPGSPGWDSGNVTVISNASNSNLQVGLHGLAVSNGTLTAAPSSVSFGQVQVGKNTTQSVVLTNSGSAVTLTAFQATGTGFSVSGPTVPLSLSRGQSITLTATFTPQTTGTASGSVFVPGPGLSVSLTGTGTSSAAAVLTVSPTSLNFGSVNVGTPTTQASTMTATGGSVTVTSASSSSSLFAVSGITLPMTLSSGQSAEINVIYTPTTNGASSATLTLVSNASDSKATESLTGTGITAPHSVDLSWNASTSSVSGYNVYRGTTSGVYTKVNSALDPGTNYTDNTVASGMTYFYAATAVDSSGQESAYSSPIQVSIP